ncbi:Myb-like_protein [Hexamita inflata]|uniref:Myb-like protein n=1 Tax=Hexamita inflata TaxID=28002 RepID=A0AA86R1A9_9EUKA|nr:Myb-like protein [Hexamita inflata]
MQDNSISVSYEPFDQLLSNSTIQDQKLAQDIFMKLSQLSQVQDDIEIRLQKLQNTKWSIAENDLFLKALETVSFTDTEGIQKIVQTKTQKQIATYVSKLIEKLENAYNQEMSEEQITALVPIAANYLKKIDQMCILETIKLLKNYVLNHQIDDPEQICDIKKCILTSYIETEIKQAEEISKKIIPVIVAAENIYVAAGWIASKYNLMPEEILTATLAIYLNKQGFRLESGQQGLELRQIWEKYK